MYSSCGDPLYSTKPSDHTVGVKLLGFLFLTRGVSFLKIVQDDLELWGSSASNSASQKGGATAGYLILSGSLCTAVSGM